MLAWTFVLAAVATLATAQLPDFVTKHVDAVNKLCGDAAPAKCNCTFGLEHSIGAPYTFQTLSLCRYVRTSILADVVNFPAGDV
jgi:hypothetical protein